MDGWYGVGEVAAMFGIGRDRIAQAERHGEIPPARRIGLGKSRVYDDADIVTLREWRAAVARRVEARGRQTP